MLRVRTNHDDKKLGSLTWKVYLGLKAVDRSNKKEGILKAMLLRPPFLVGDKGIESTNSRINHDIYGIKKSLKKRQ